MKKCIVVCLTATPTSNKQVHIENMIFNSLQLKAFSYWPSSVKKPEDRNSLQELERMTLPELATMIKDKSTAMAVIVFTTA